MHYHCRVAQLLGDLGEAHRMVPRIFSLKDRRLGH